MLTTQTDPSQPPGQPAGLEATTGHVVDQVDELAALEQAAVAAADHLADLSELYSRFPYAGVLSGAYSRVRPVVAEAWLLTLHMMIDNGEMDAFRGRTVSRRYLHALVDQLAAAADHRTGRNCMPGHVELGAQLGRPIKPAVLAAMTRMTPERRAQAEARIHHDRTRQVYNAIQVLQAAGVLVCIEQGRILGYLERLELHANGSDRRRARAVYALTLPRTRQPAPLPHRQPRLRTLILRTGLVDNCQGACESPEPIFYTPRSGSREHLGSDALVVFCPSASDLAFLDRENHESDPSWGQPAWSPIRHSAEEQLQDAASRRLAPKKRAPWDPPPGLSTFVVALRRALPDQLGGANVTKLACTTMRFWKAGWEPLEVAAAVQKVYADQRRPFPTYRPGEPAAWLGKILKSVDPALSPAVRRYDDWAYEAETELCRHGEPGGARLSLATGRSRCPLCRHELAL